MLQFKIILHIKKQDNPFEWKKTTDDNIKMTHMSGLSDKDFIAAIIKMLQWAIMNILWNKWKNRKCQHRDKKISAKNQKI